MTKKPLVTALLLKLPFCTGFHYALPHTTSSSLFAKTGTALFSNSNEDSPRSRRTFMGTFLTFTSGVTLGSSSGNAVDPLFRPNPLTNPMLEQLRIWDQEEKDNIRYEGELSIPTIANKNKSSKGYTQLLLPILSIEQDIIQLYDILRLPNIGDALSDSQEILKQSKWDKVSFKRVFNAFADNIYYIDPDRANLYLMGGATPKNEQSIAYLLRNDILTNIEALQAEVDYWMKEKANGGEVETEDLFTYSQQAKDGIVKYLELVSPLELKMAREAMASMK